MITEEMQPLISLQKGIVSRVTLTEALGKDKNWIQQGRLNGMPVSARRMMCLLGEKFRKLRKIGNTHRFGNFFNTETGGQEKSLSPFDSFDLNILVGSHPGNSAEYTRKMVWPDAH